MADSETQDRDIDTIIRQVQQQMSDVEVRQLQKTWPADDDGLWYFFLPGIKQDIQVESSFGTCPFLVETDEQCCKKSRTADTIDEAITMITDYLKAAR